MPRERWDISISCRGGLARQEQTRQRTQVTVLQKTAPEISLLLWQPALHVICCISKCNIFRTMHFLSLLHPLCYNITFSLPGTWLYVSLYIKKDLCIIIRWGKGKNWCTKIPRNSGNKVWCSKFLAEDIQTLHWVPPHCSHKIDANWSDLRTLKMNGCKQHVQKHLFHIVHIISEHRA